MIPPKKLETINKFSKAAGYKINIKKTVEFLYRNKKLPKREIKKIVLFTITTKE